MNIAFVTSTKRWGGVKTWIIEFSSELAKRGNNVFIFSRDDKLIKKATAEGLKVIKLEFGFDYNPKAILQFMYYFKKYNIGIACLNVQKELRSAGIAAKILKIPVIHRVGLKSDIVDKADFRIINKYVTDHILVPCKTMKNELVEEYTFLNEKDISVIYNGKNIITSETDKSLHKPVKFVISSKVEKSKGHFYLANVLLSLKEKNINWQLDIFGEGNLSDWLEGFITDNDLSNNVQIKGFNPDIKYLLSDYDFGLLTSFSEGFPNVLLEYMSAGLPVISSNVSGVFEIVKTRENGFLFQPGDENTLEELMEKAVLMNDFEYENMVTQAIATIKDRFSLKSNGLVLEEFFKDAINKKNTQKST